MDTEERVEGKAREWLEAFREMLSNRPRALLLHQYAQNNSNNNNPGPSQNQNQNQNQNQIRIQNSKSGASANALRSHPFGSFAPPRKHQSASWYVCGREYFGAVCCAVRAARRQVFLADWRLNPDFLLCRPPDAPVVLKDLLRAVALSGVEVYILLYKEASEALQKKHRTAKVCT